MLAAEATHRDHAIVEQVIAELKHGSLAHLPSGIFTANAAWLACAAIAHNLTRAAATLAGGRHRRARTGTIRAQLIATTARTAHSAHRQVLHLPRDWPYEPGLDELFRRALHDPSQPPPDHRPTPGLTGNHQWRSRTTGSPPTPTNPLTSTRDQLHSETMIDGGSRLNKPHLGDHLQPITPALLGRAP